MLPGSDHGPARLHKPSRVIAVALLVPGELGNPIRLISDGQRPMGRAAMPETAIEENSDPLLRKDDVNAYRPTKRKGYWEVFAEAHPMLV
jgi:hypothetical protein